MFNSIYKKIYKEIKKYDTIVIARHVGPDPDALASSIALRDIILNTFPKKNVYAVGCTASRFRFLGVLDKVTDEMYDNALLIVTDTPDKKRVVASGHKCRSAPTFCRKNTPCKPLQVRLRRVPTAQ